MPFGRGDWILRGEHLRVAKAASPPVSPPTWPTLCAVAPKEQRMANIHGHNVALQQAAVIAKGGGGGLAAATAWCLQLGAGGQARPAAVQWPLAARRHCGHGRKEEGQSFGAMAQKRARREGDARGSVAGLRNTERSSPLRFPSQAARRERKKTKFLFGVYLSRVLCPDARRKKEKAFFYGMPFGQGNWI